jgi:glycogen phosphorylase
MKKLQTYQVYPNLPEPLKFLETLSRNYWWAWTYDAVDLFRRIDRGLWKRAQGNPIIFATLVPQKRLSHLAQDDSYLVHLDRVREAFEKKALTPKAPPDPAFGPGEVIAYLSMEFGIHESLPIYSGGLGILAGDHLKAASNMDLPLVGIGLLYRQGYFHQFLDPNGWQQEEYPDTDIFSLPLERAKDPEGREVAIQVTGPDGPMDAVVWKVRVGRITLLLLDTYLASNPESIRDVTARLYAGGARVRLAQEALLGIGGIKALEAVGLTAKVCHMNEGHAAFSGLERLAQTMARHQVDLKTAHEIVARSTVFTTHTPVAAGHDEFPSDMVTSVLQAFTERLGVTAKTILSWGQPAGAPENSPMSMFILALRMAQFCNGVSELHGKVARKMWSFVWPDRPVDEIPISHITNGVHVPTWMSPEMAAVCERYLGPEWYMCSLKPEEVKKIDEIYDEEIWRAHEMSRARLLRACRNRMVRQYARRNAPAAMIEDAESVLDQDTLTIGFARRFATYKRAGLLLLEPRRLEALLTDAKRPVQIIFAGKAHPQDEQGKQLIKQLIEFCRQEKVKRRVVFLEDYDIQTARYLVQGCDVWLNTPRRPYEACGTSGMKAALNGVLNLSILDGWWAEGYNESVGWAIGHGDEIGDPTYLDAVESQALFNLLENGVIPKFYNRKNGDHPAEWVTMMKASMQLAIGKFCSLRMVGDYDDRFYIPAAVAMANLLEDGARLGRELAERHERLRQYWPQLKIDAPVRETSGPFRVGDAFQVTTVAYLGDLRPEEVSVDLYYGLAASIDAVVRSQTVSMSMVEQLGDGRFLYRCKVQCQDAGRYAFTSRIVPAGDDWIRTTPGLVTWA